MNTENKIIDITRRAIDLHVHIGPEIIPRKYTVPTIIRKEKGKIKGMALKNHFFSTVPLIVEPTSQLKLIGSVVLRACFKSLNVFFRNTFQHKPRHSQENETSYGLF